MRASVPHKCGRWQLHPRSSPGLERCARVFAERKGSKAADNENAGLGLKVVWVAAEQLGKLVGGSGGRSQPGASTAPRGLTWPEVVQSVRADYDAEYFISGKGDLAAYDPQCLFADPFTSFRGVDRFKQNVGNLGGLMQDVDLRIVKWEELEAEGKLKASWKFSCRLQLPWKPILAAAGSTTHTWDPKTGLIVSHYEDWDVEVKDVLRRLLKPGNRIPQSEVEVFMASLDSGDVYGAWQVAAGPVFKFTLPVVVPSLIFRAVLGEGMPGGVFGFVEGVTNFLCVASAVTWVARIARGLSGTDSS